MKEASWYDFDSTLDVVPTVIRVLRCNAFNVDEVDYEKNTLLHIACLVKSNDLVQYLVVEKKCSVNKVNKDGSLPLHIACYSQSLEMVKLAWPHPGGGPGGHRTPPPPPPPPHTHTHTHSTAIYKYKSIRISFRLGGLRSMIMAIPFSWGGGRGEGRECQRKSKTWGKLCLL